VSHTPWSTAAKRALGVACLCAGLSVFGVGDAPAASLRLTWSSNTEADLAGYRLRLGTASGQYTRTIEAGSATTVDVADLATDTTYFFAVFAYDLAGNESAASTEVLGRVPSTTGPLPLIDSLIDVDSGSMFVIRGLTHTILVHGRNIQDGATLDLGAGVSAGPLVRSGTNELTSVALVSGTAVPGPRVATVTNPDLGATGVSGLIAIVRNPDTNADCTVDVLDLNALARAWNLSAGEPGFLASTDLDGDQYVGPEDLTIFVRFLGKPLSGCP
jgi:hypothetical protein